MMSYEPVAVLRSIDANAIKIVLLCGVVAMAPTYLWFIEAVRVAQREKVVTMPVFCTFFWFAHDTSYLMRFDKWFSTYSHWYLELFWVMLVATVILEIIYIVQIIKYGRSASSPLSQRQYQWLVLAGVAGTVVIWTLLKSVLDDDLYIIAFGLTVVVYPLFGIPMLLNPERVRGQTPIMWIGFLGLAIGYFLATTLYFGDAFRSPAWIAAGLVSVAGGLTGLALVSRKTVRMGRSVEESCE